MNNKIKNLLKESSETEKPKAKPQQIIAAKKAMLKICHGLAKGTQQYKPSLTIKQIKEYLAESDNKGPVMYSYITNYVFSMDTEHMGSFLSNLDSLMTYANSIEEDDKLCQRFVIKLYDHTQLAISQIDNANKVFNDSLELARQNLRKESESIKKEFVSILGIFAAVVIVFMSSTAFSTSVLENIHLSSVYRISLIGILIGLVIINSLYALLYYLEKIVRGASVGVKPLMLTNAVFIIMLAIVLLMWYYGAVELRNVEVFKKLVYV